MQRTRICIIGILITTFSFTQVEMTIQDVDTNAGTLNIYMKNIAGCSYCTDDEFSNNEEDCLAYGTDPTSAADSTVLDATWKFDSDISDAATCAGSCTNISETGGVNNVSQYQNKSNCLTTPSGHNGICTDPTFKVKVDCKTAGTCSNTQYSSESSHVKLPLRYGHQQVIYGQIMCGQRVQKMAFGFLVKLAVSNFS